MAFIIIFCYRNREKKCNAAIKNVETRKKKKKDSSVLWEKMGRFHLVLFDILLEDAKPSLCNTH